MTRTALLAAAMAAALFAGDPALGDTSRNPQEPFADGSVVAVEDEVLDRQVGLGAAAGGASPTAGSEGSRMAVILWDEARPPVTPPPISGMLQANGQVVVTVGHNTPGT